MYALALASPMSMPNLSSSLWMRGAPKSEWILPAHLADQLPDFLGHRRAAGLAVADSSCPERSEALVVSGNDCPYQKVRTICNHGDQPFPGNLQLRCSPPGLRSSPQTLQGHVLGSAFRRFKLSEQARCVGLQLDNPRAIKACASDSPGVLLEHRRCLRPTLVLPSAK
jgi:hypothetical protein